MKRRKLFICWSALQATSGIITCLMLLVTQYQAAAGIVPPPWSDPAKNPCATMTGGWQLLYWAPLKKCFKIFTLGYPCPESMELSPTATSARRKDAPAAECRCPPGKALSSLTNLCHKIYERGPCEKGEYFQPMSEQPKRWGSCYQSLKCEKNMLFWPRDNKCYMQYTKGPCAKGKLLVKNVDGLAECQCEARGKLGAYYYQDEDSCYEHYTKGPCSTPGHIFLPGGRCDCQRHLPQYHRPQQMCFELGTPGPCPPGHIYRIPDNNTNNHAGSANIQPRAECMCKDGYALWNDDICYRLYTRGPCASNEFLVNGPTCVHNFCGKNRLYFPAEGSCYRIGSQGPCALHKVVVFDFSARPSIDGISYKGICGCAGIIANLDQQCVANNEREKSICEATPGMVEIKGECYKLYTRGPCGVGQWLQPIKAQSANGTAIFAIGSNAKCVCRPDYTSIDEDQSHGFAGTARVHNCSAPSVSLARYLTTAQKIQSSYMNYVHLS